MSRCKKKNDKIKKKRKRVIILLIVFIGIFFCYFITYGQDVFYAMKTFFYENKTLEIKIKVEKNDDLQDMNLNFVNEGSCDVYLRGFVFVYPKVEGNTGTTLSNSSIKVNYGDNECWFISKDNYIYYIEPLKVGERTETPMVESIEINLSEEDKNNLGDVELQVDVVMEAVQMNNIAYKYEWGIGNMGLEEYFKESEDGENFETKEDSVNESIKVSFK